MSSRLTEPDAREWLESLQQVGEGWYRQVALAIRANAHKALGMDRREFAQAIGQRMIDPRQAIVELHREGHSQREIADILGVGDKTARRVLVEEGLIEVRELPAVTDGTLAGETAVEDDTSPRVVDDPQPEPIEADVTPVDTEERIDALSDDLADRVRSGDTPLDEAEHVAAERLRRIEKYVREVREALDLLDRMVGHPIPSELSTALTKEERKTLSMVLRALKEGVARGERVAA